MAGLGRQAVTLKQDEEALTREMDITGEAFEDLQEQNARLIKQLREKDDANFKLMSERIKLNQVGSPTQFYFLLGAFSSKRSLKKAISAVFAFFFW